MRQGRKSVRLSHYNYSQEGLYFVTICTSGGKYWFGSIEEHGVLCHSGIGKQAQLLLLETPKHHESCLLDEFVIMPNHAHCIIQLLDRDGCRGVRQNAQDRGGANNSDRFSHISPRRGSLSVIVRNYKAMLKRWCNESGFDEFTWQRGFYEHIIRNERELFSIRSYIINNPLKWCLDRENPVSPNRDLSQAEYFQLMM